MRIPGTTKHASAIAKEVPMPCGLQVPPPWTAYRVSVPSLWGTRSLGCPWEHPVSLRSFNFDELNPLNATVRMPTGFHQLAFKLQISMATASTNGTAIIVQNSLLDLYLTSVRW